MFFCSELHLPPCWTVSPWPSVTGSSVPATRTVKPLSLGGSFSNTTSPRAPSAGRHSESDRTSVAPPAASTKPNQTKQTKQSNHIKPYTCCDTTRVVDRHCQRLVYAYHKTTHMPPHYYYYYTQGNTANVSGRHSDQESFSRTLDLAKVDPRHVRKLDQAQLSTANTPHAQLRRTAVKHNTNNNKVIRQSC
jgi:hypothetical protein